MPTTDHDLLEDARFVYKVSGRTPRQLLAERDQPKAPVSLQACYDLGHANPSRPSQSFKWLHLTNVNAYAAGQADAQNQAPSNRQYSSEQYHQDTFERINYAVQFDGEN